LNIPAGNWNFETFFEASSGGGSPTFYIELYKYDGTTFTLIASNSTTPKLINDGTTIEAYFSALAVPQTTLTLTDRLAVRIYVTTAGRTITLHTENGHLCQVVTTFTTGLTALNGLTAQVQYFATGTSGTDFNIASATATHTFNLPTASATNRGALSSGDWTTFNNKIGPSDTASMLLPYLRKTDTASMLSPYYRTATANAALATKLNISDTAAMLLGYTRVQRFTDSLTNVQSRIQTKQNILTLTTTGTSGAATLVGATLNIPQYQAALTNPVTGTGTTNYLPKFTGSTTVGNSALQEVSGNLGLGVTPSAWGGGNVALDMGGDPFSGINASLRLGLTTNAYAIGATYYYRASGLSSQQYRLSVGTNNHEWYVAPSGTAGAAISYTQAMTLDASGRLGIGTTTITSGTRLEVAGDISIRSGANGFVQTTDANSLILRADQQAGTANKGVYLQYWNSAAWQNALYVNNVSSGFSNLIMMPSGGNLLVGTTTDNGARLQVSGNQTISGTLGVSGLLYSADATGLKYQLNGNVTANYYGIEKQAAVAGGDGSFKFESGKTNAGEFIFSTGGTQRLLIAAGGAATFSSLAGTGTRVVEASSAGLLSATKVIDAGTYTPTVTIESGGGSSPSANVCRWTRVGNIVTVTGNIYFEPQGSGYVTKDNIIRITYPIARTSTGICSGPISAYPVGGVTANVSGYVSGTSTSWAQLHIKTEYSGSGCEPYFTFSYEVD
jgi:hypothetical protein